MPTPQSDGPDVAPANVTALDLFIGFATVGMLGFGGIAAALFHVVVERRKWLTVDEYASTLGLGQVLPGANLINLATIIGDKYKGAPGAVIALSGLLCMPIIILVGLANLYDQFSNLPDVKAGISAAAAGAVGLTFGTGIKLGRTILKSPFAIMVAVVSFVAIGLLRLPMIATILALAPLAVAGGFWRERS